MEEINYLKHNGISGIYIIICEKACRYYVGSTYNLYRRNNDHSRHLTKNKHLNYKLQQDWNSFGFNNFKFFVLEFCSRKELGDKEQYYLDLYESYNDKYGYNISNKAFRKKSFEERIKEKFHVRKTIKSKKIKKVKIPDKVKQKISEATKLAMANPEVRDNVSIAQKKRFSNPEEKTRMREILDPIVKSKEFADEHRELAKLRWKNPEYRSKQIETRKELFSNPLKKEKMKEISNNMWNDPKKYKSTLEKRSNISKEQVEKILSLKDSGLSYRQIGAQVGCRREVVGRICRGENKFALLN